MNITRIWKVYFSPTGNTDQAVSHLADALRDKLKCPIEKYDFTLPASREALPFFVRVIWSSSARRFMPERFRTSFCLLFRTVSRGTAPLQFPSSPLETAVLIMD